MVSRKSTSRKGTSRKGRKSTSRKGRKNTRKNVSRKGRGRKMWGGEYDPSALSRAQGEQFLETYGRREMSGGGYIHGAPVSAITDSMLPQDMVAGSRVGSTLTSLHEASGMRDSDQTGGGRKRRNGRKNTRKGRKNTRKGCKNTRKGRKNTRKGRNGRKQAGGWSPVDSPTMLLDGGDSVKAGTSDFSDPFARL